MDETPGASRRLLEMDPAAVLNDGDAGAREKWEAISDLDSFFARVYAYYRERGLRCILASRIISLLTLAWTIVRARLFFNAPPPRCLFFCAPRAAPENAPRSARRSLPILWYSKLRM